MAQRCSLCHLCSAKQIPVWCSCPFGTHLSSLGSNSLPLRRLFPPSSRNLISSLEEVKLTILRKPVPVFLEEADSLLPLSHRKLVNFLLEEVKRETSRKLIPFLLEEANSFLPSSLKEVVSVSPQRNWLPSSFLIGGADSLPLWTSKIARHILSHIAFPRESCQVFRGPKSTSIAPLGTLEQVLRGGQPISIWYSSWI